MSVSETEKLWIPFLQDAMFAGKPICILPACDMKIPIETDEDIDESQVLSDILVSWIQWLVSLSIIEFLLEVT